MKCNLNSNQTNIDDCNNLNSVPHVSTSTPQINLTDPSPPIKKKRGRPRKYPKEDTTNKVKKKRGRPKGKKNVQKKVNRTRGRPKNITNVDKVYSNKKIMKNIENENVIIHLPIKIEDIKTKKENIFKYDPEMTIPKPWNEEEFSSYSNITKDVQAYTDTDNTLNTRPDNGVDTGTNTGVHNGVDTGTNTDIHMGLTSSNLSEINNNLPKNNNCVGDNTTIGISEDQYYSNYNYNLIHTNNWYKETKHLKTKNYIQNLLEYKKQRDKNIHVCGQQNHCSKKILKEFQTNTWPIETSVHCWWCCHPFNTVPCSIPEKIEDKTFIVYGVFCSPECCAAHLFNDTNHSNSVSIWTKYSLLNVLYKDIYKGKQIGQAYSRELLKKFGGCLTINEFRNTNRKVSYTISMPNMKSIIPRIEQSYVQTSYSSNRYAINDEMTDIYTVPNNIIEPASDTLILKRSKPFRKYENTLEKCMNLKLNTK